MRKDKGEAIKLRLKGFSYSEINKKLDIPKSTLSLWLRDLEISDNARSRIRNRHKKKSLEGLIKRNKQQTSKAKDRAKKIRINAKSKIGKLTKRDLMMLGLSLYWGEGYKRPIVKDGKEKTYHPVSLSNSDPEIIKIFIKFLIEIYNVPKEKIKLSVRLYKHMNEKKIINFWLTITDLPKENLYKTGYKISRSSKGNRPFNRLPYGTVQVRVNSTEIYHKIMGMIEGLK